MAGRKIGLREVRALQPDQTIWDSTVAGFGARRQRSEAVSYLLIYRTQEGRQRWHTIGRHGSPWTPETARAEAQRLLGLIVGGADPAATKKAVRQAAPFPNLRPVPNGRRGRRFDPTQVGKKASTLLLIGAESSDTSSRSLALSRSPPSPKKILITSCTMSPPAKPRATPNQPKSADSPGCGAVEVQPAVP